MDHDGVLDPSGKCVEAFFSIPCDGIFIDPPFVFFLRVNEQTLELNFELIPIIFGAVFKDVASCCILFDWQPLSAEELLAFWCCRTCCNDDSVFQ